MSKVSKRSQCMYCNSYGYGRPCIYSPTNTHVHLGNFNQCIYCGSKYRGAGCLYNPYGKVHVMGPDYAGVVKEQTTKSAICSYIFEKLTNKPEILEASFSPLDRLYTRMAYLLGTTAQPFTDALVLNEQNIQSQLTKEQIVAAFELRILLEQKLKEMDEILAKGNQSLPVEVVEESLVEAILNRSQNL